jgi:PmbA protein
MTKQSQDSEILHAVIERALKAGAKAADGLLLRSVSLSHAQRLGQPERLERAEEQDLGLRVLIGRRQAVASSTDLQDDALEQLVERAIAMARSVPEDRFAGLAEPEQLAREIPRLDICDSQEPAPERLIERARACEEAARAVAGVTNSEGAEAGYGRSEVTLVASNGFEGAYQSSSHSLGVSVLAGEGLAMERDYDFTHAVYESDLEDAAAVGRRAGERAVKRLGAKRPKTGRYPVIFDPRVSNGLLRHLAGAISGSAIARGTSFLKDKLGQQVMSAGLEVIDDPHRSRGFRSKPFDAEGIANRTRKIVEDGRLTTWILDLATARQLGMETTGHAARGSGGPPSPAVTNLHLAPGSLSREDLIGAVEQGLLITEMMGMGVNLVTGDYSRGAAGYWIEKGEIAYPVSELTVAGNLKDMLLAITPANDLEFRYGINAPSLRVDAMTIAGA